MAYSIKCQKGQQMRSTQQVWRTWLKSEALGWTLQGELREAASHRNLFVLKYLGLHDEKTTSFPLIHSKYMFIKWLHHRNFTSLLSPTYVFLEWWLARSSPTSRAMPTSPLTSWCCSPSQLSSHSLVCRSLYILLCPFILLSLIYLHT